MLAYRCRRIAVEWTIIAVSVLYAALGVVLRYASYRLIDLVTPTVDFAAELKNGNVAMAIFIAALLAWVRLALLQGAGDGRE
jgi:uncharacterized membrane protein YjfL (UPF0719 family)